MMELHGNMRDTDIPWSGSGGDYDTDISSSQVFTQDTYDIAMNVKNIVDLWVTGSLTNYGFIIKKRDDDEYNEIKMKKMAFYSKNTHTVYMPELEFWYDDSVIDSSSYYPYNTSSLYSASKLTVDDFDIDMIGLKQEYKYTHYAVIFFQDISYKTTKKHFMRLKEQNQHILQIIKYSIAWKMLIQIE
jgi:hypothetical protein